MAIAIPSLDKAISVIQAAIKDEIALQLGLKGDLSFIRDELDMMKAFLMVAEEEREHNEVVKVWTDQINHLALDVEHCLNDNRDRVEKYPRWLFLLTIPARHEIAYTLKELKARVEDVSKRNLRYRLVKDSDSAATLGIKKLLQASSSTTKGSVELVDLCEVIVNEDEELKVMSVWGRDGSDPGKTSVVREAYNSREVRDKFPCRAWVRLAHPFNPNDFLHSLVRQFYGNSLSLEARATVGVGVMRKMEEVIAQGRLAEEFDAHVNDKKYLLVIDDLTTMVEWDWILTYLPDRKKGSKIIVSTQQVEIANLCAAQPCRVAEIKQRLSHRSVYLFFNESAQSQVPNFGHTIMERKPTLKRKPTMKAVADNTQDRQDKTTLKVHVDEIQENQIQEGSSANNYNLVPPNANNHNLVPQKENKPMLMVSALESQDYEVQEVSIGNNYNLTPPREDKPALETCADEIDEDQIQEASSKLNYSSVQPKEDQDAKLVQGESSTIQGETNVTIQHDDDELIGRQEEKAHLIQLICKGGEKRVISMWGSGGIGKTALAGSIFTSDEVCSHFQISVWVSVSNDFDHIYFFKTLAAELNSESPQVQEKASQLKSSLADMGTEELIEESTSLLRGMRYLIVLDGLLTLEKTHMELILSKLPDDKNGSCVIITTRLVTAAELYASDKENIYELGPLNDHEAHDLLISKVFGNVQIVDVAPELTEETKVIAKKCQGVPLAICVISSVLSTTPRIAEEWRKATDELMSVINEPNPDGMLKILKNSYDQLPYYLKPCFLYLAIFPEDYNIRRGRLVRRWTAEEYAMDYEQYSAEQMSERYFDELISRSMIQPSDGGCRVHDLMLDLAVSLSTKENLMLKLEDTTSGGSSAQRTVQHLVISSGWKRSKPEFDRTVELTRLHSLTVFGEWSPFFISVSTKQLVVLDLEDTSGLTDEHLLHIVGRLRRLRYLSLRGCKGIRQLPNTIGNLNDLQTLDVRGTGVVRMPRATVRLLKLQHLLTSGFDSDKVTPQSKRRRPVARKRNMMSCFPSPAAPASSTDGVRMPEGTGMLHELLTLGVIDATASGAVLKELKELDRLRKLAVAGISAENGKDLADAINDHRRLKSLLVQSMDHDGLQAFVDSMLDSGCSAPKNLQSLKLQGRLVSLPQWIKQLEKLHKLTLTGTRLLQMQESLSFISNLPKLAILHLKEESLMECKSHEHLDLKSDSFPNLVELEIFELPGLSTLQFNKQAAPRLMFLRIGNMKGTSIRGLQFLPCLQEVSLTGLDDAEINEVKRQLSENMKKPILKL